ncbi:MAG: ATP synthase F1 subunit gamma [Planctomycetes bacterium]|nr:ATP synthase F1 subunit gamma [Planctomycetota bacterium]
MAKTKELRGRIRSVKSTRKITKTMELVATSKMKRAQERVSAAGPYVQKLREVLAAAISGGVKLDLPLLQTREPVKKVLVQLLTANRGLCGGFNANLIKLAKKTIAEQRELGREVRLDVCGKKGIAALRFQKYEITRAITDMTDKPTFADARRLVDPLIEEYLKGAFDEIYIVYSHWKSMGSQPPSVLKLLPVDAGAAAAQAGKGAAKYKTAEFIFSPSAKEILEDLLPKYVVQTVYTCIAMNVAGEQVARRTAMKSATDNAEDMIKYLTRNLNRARQAAITQEIAEIVGGAAAMKG